MVIRNQQDQNCLTRIEGKLDSVHGKVDVLHKDIMGLMTKVVLGMIAMSLAAVGIKYAGTPLITDISFFLTWVAGFMSVGVLLKYWQRLNRWQYRMVWISFTVFLFYSVGCRTFVFKSGMEAAPWWYAPGIDFLMSWVSVSLIINIWKLKVR